MNRSDAGRNRPWAIMPEQLGAMLARLEQATPAAGEPSAALSRRAAIALRNGADSRIAVLPLLGVLSQRRSDFAGDTSLEEFRAAFDQACRDPSVEAILIEVDSPGGSIYGVAELAAQVFAARGTKRIAAIANTCAASAAYWIGSAAGELSVSPSGQVGSIGIVAIHQDFSRADEAAGVDVTLIGAGKFKTEGNEFEPLGDTARASLQKRVDEYYGMFVRAVARQRGVGQAAVRDGFGEGRLVGADDALKLGMVDRVETLDQMLARLGGGKLQTSANARAEQGHEIEIARARLKLRCAQTF